MKKSTGGERRTAKRRGRPPAPGESWRSAHRRKEIALANLRELEEGVRRGALLDAEAVAREWQDLLRTVQAGVLAVVSRLRQRLPHLTAEDAQVLDDELRAALTALGRDAAGAA